MVSPPSFSTLEHFTRELEALALRLRTEEPEELRLLRTGGLANKPGSFGQYFGAWDVAAGMVRDYAMYALYPLLRMARSGGTCVGDFLLLMDEFVAPYTGYLGYSGFAPLERYADELRRLSRGASVRDIEPALCAYVKYANRLCAWLYHYFPWSLGEGFKYTEPHASEGVGAPVVDSLKPSQTYIRLRWEPLGVSVRAWLAVEHNPDLCNDLLGALPFTVLQDHPIVSGESVFAWTPFVSTAPVRTREMICDGPIGRLRFSLRTGQKLIVQYGRTTETIQSPVLGSVVPDDIHLLANVGRAVWESTYRTKELIWLSVTG